MATMIVAQHRESHEMWPSRIPTDEALLRAVSSRDAASFATLYDRHAKAVMAVAFRLVGDREIAADLTQATFLKLWERPHAVATGEATLRPWLLRVVRNAAVDSLRRRRLRAMGPDDRVVADEALDDIAEVVVTRARAVATRDLLAALESPQRRVIELAYFGELTQTQIASVLGVPLGTVKSRMRLGLGKLRALAQHEGWEAR